MQSAIQPL